MNEAELITRADANLLHAARSWARASAAGEVWEDTGVFVASSGTDLRSFNLAFVTEPVGAHALGRVCAYFEQRAVKYRIRFREDIGIEPDALRDAGLVERGGIPSLVLAPPTTTGRENGQLEIAPVTDSATLRHHIEVVAAGFDWEPDMLAGVFTERLLGDAAWRGYVGYADGRAVAASQLYSSDGVAGIYYMATRDEFRRRGFGEAMTRHAMNEGLRAGCDAASLQASPMGLPIYARMGFRRVSYYHTFVPKEAE